MLSGPGLGRRLSTVLLALCGCHAVLGVDNLEEEQPEEKRCGDCGTLAVAACHVALCNEQTGDCVVEPVPDGSPCDDGLFCSVGDSCSAGICRGAGVNDCGLAPDQCQAIECDESTRSCQEVAGHEGAVCTSTNGCVVNPKCSQGSCTGTVKSCAGKVTLPSECHVAACQSPSGNCVAVAGNNGASCTHPDPCMEGGKCSNGKCSGAAPKDCSGVDDGCHVGKCNAMTGVCEPEQLPEGTSCPEATNACSDGKCDAAGVCQGTPINEAGPCDDGDACTELDSCSLGKCGGAPITACVNQDGCCPMGCTDMDDDDCGCGVNLAATATPSHSGGGTGGYGPGNWNDGKDEQDCLQAGCVECYGWLTSSNTPSGKWVQYEWPSPVDIGSMYVDANECNTQCGNSSGRTLLGGTVQYWDGTQWLTAQTFAQNDGDLALSFNPKLGTTKLRIYDLTTASGCGQGSNTMIYEWSVYQGTGCQPP